MTLKERKYISNNKFDIGKSRSLGYQPSVSTIDTSSFNSTPGYNMSNDISLINSNTLNSGISKAVQYGTNLKDIASNFTSAGAAASLNIAKANAMGLGEGAKLTGEQAAYALAEEGASVSKAGLGLSTAGKVAAGAGALYSGFNLVNDISNANNHLTSSDLLNMSGKSTQSKYGVNYTTYNGFNADQARSYTNALTKANKTNFIMDSTSLGASLGSFGGLAGMGIGAGIGAVIGGIGSLLGFGDNSDEVEREIANTKAAINGYNTQAEAEAGSQGLRNLFYQAKGLSADKGKNRTNNGEVGQLGIIHTSHGIVPGIQFGLAGKGESIYNPEDGTASVYKEGRKRVDNIPTGVPLSSYDKGKEWSNTIIFGNRINPETGNSFADDAKPYSKILEKLNKEEDNMNLSKHTREINIKNALNKLNNLADILMFTANCGKNRFDNGWEGYASMLAPRLLQAGLILGSGENYNPTVKSSYVADTYSPSIINNMYSRTYNANPAITNVRNNERQLIYNTNNAGGLSSGMRRFLNQSNSYAAQNAINTILADKYNKDTEQYNKAAAYALDYNKNTATRQQAAMSEYNQALREAYGKSYNAKQARLQSLLNIPSTIASDMFQYQNLANSKRNQERMLNLYDQQIANDSKSTSAPIYWLDKDGNVYYNGKKIS